jgi:hypothetical protein
MKRWLRTLNVSVEDYLAYAGERTLRDFAARHPDWPLRAWVSLVIQALGHGYLVADEGPEAEAVAHRRLVDARATGRLGATNAKYGAPRAARPRAG